MRRSAVLMTFGLACLPAICAAQPVTGLYVGLGAGGNFKQTSSRTDSYSFGPSTFQVFNGQFVSPGNSGRAKSLATYDAGAVGVGSVGYGLGNGLRVEIEGNYRRNSLSAADGPANKTFGTMMNALYDLDVGSSFIFPYAGVGVGYEWVDRGFAVARTNSFGYQAILGVATPVPWVPGLSATLEYRFMGLTDADKTSFTPAIVTPSSTIGASRSKYTYSDEYSHSVMIGLRYAFNTPSPAALVPAPAAAPAVLPTRTYLVFFDWDRAELTDRARQIVAEVAQNTTRVQYSRIEVQGNADRSGTPAYNQRLSLQRAQVVAAELVRDGVPGTAIDIQAFGDTRPLVPTAAGVREPQNRRVAVILR